MKQSAGSNICRHSAKRIKTLLDKSKYLLSHAIAEYSKNSHFSSTHKCDLIKFPQLISKKERLCIHELDISPSKCKNLHEKSQLIQLPHFKGPLNILHEEVATTQCCVNQKYLNHFFLPENKNPHPLLSKRHIQHSFREYLLASKTFKTMADQPIPNAKKYQIALLKEETAQEKFNDSWPLNWILIKTEERHFLMGHTIKHP